MSRSRSKSLPLPSITLEPRDVLNELEFLSSVDSQGDVYYDESAVRNAVRRYERCWIPLIKELEDEEEHDDLEWAPPMGQCFELCCNAHDARRRWLQ